MIFVDTGAFLARYVQQDQFHKRALACWCRLAREETRCATSSHVLDETFTLLGRCASYAFAAERARHLLTSKVLTILRSEHDDELAAVSLFEKYADQRASFTDCVSFVLMRRASIPRVFTLDAYFRLAGFEVWP